MKINPSGTWIMSGKQTHVDHSKWEAVLELYPNKRLSYRVTKGANQGARRSGHWDFVAGVLTMRYQAPNVGLVTWKSTSVSPTSMSGKYRTPEDGPQPEGWGGTWEATKTASPAMISPRQAKVDRELMRCQAGTWNMNGWQTNVDHSKWEAVLELYPNKRLSYRVTKGANQGARRSGHWDFVAGVLTMRYQAPNVGLVTWKSTSVSPTSMSGKYRTPEDGPQPEGWGGTWEATKASATTQMAPSPKHNNHTRPKSGRCGARCRNFARYGFCDRAAAENGGPCWMHR